MAIKAKFRTTDSFDGTRLAWTRGGRKGSTVVLANGIVCSDTYWTYLYPFLIEQGHRVVFWDYRAHGRSAAPANPNEISLTAHARDLWSVADAAGVDRVTLVGHSMGVQTILEAYRLHPERVDGIVAIAGPYEHPLKTFYHAPLAHYLLPLMELSWTTVPAVTRAAWKALTAQIDMLYWSGRVSRMIGAEAERELMEEYFRHIARLDPMTVFRMVKAMSEHSARDLLPLIEAPTLVLAGGHDVMTPPGLAQEMAELIPHARCEVLASGSHTLPIDDPGWVNSQIRDFLATTTNTY